MGKGKEEGGRESGSAEDQGNVQGDVQLPGTSVQPRGKEEKKRGEKTKKT